MWSVVRVGADDQVRHQSLLQLGDAFDSIKTVLYFS